MHRVLLAAVLPGHLTARYIGSSTSGWDLVSTLILPCTVIQPRLTRHFSRTPSPPVLSTAMMTSR
jgi:hypothetical protein